MMGELGRKGGYEMESQKINAMATSMIAFSTSLGVLAAILYYFYQIRNITFLQAVVISEIYIVLNLTFMYILKRWWLE